LQKIFKIIFHLNYNNIFLFFNTERINANPPATNKNILKDEVMIKNESENKHSNDIISFVSENT